MKLKFNRVKFDTIFGASFNDLVIAGDTINGAEEDDEALMDISCEIIQGKFYKGDNGPIEQDVFYENLSFENDKGLFESEKPIVAVYANMKLNIVNMGIDFLEDDEDEIIYNMKERIQRVEDFVAQLITHDEFDFDV